MRSVFIILSLISVDILSAQHTYSIDYISGNAQLTKLNSSLARPCNQGQKIFSGDKLTLTGSTWVILSDEKNSTYKVQGSGEFTLTEIDKIVSSQKTSAFQKYAAIVKKHLVKNENDVGLSFFGGITEGPQLSHDLIAYNSDTLVFSFNEELILPLNESNQPFIKLILKQSNKIVLDTIIQQTIQINLSNLSPHIDQSQPFFVILDKDLGLDPVKDLMKSVEIIIDKDKTPACLTDFFSNDPLLKTDNSKFTTLLKICLLIENNYYGQANKLLKENVNK